jgi:plasmid stability protein
MKNIQIRDVPDDVHANLAAAAAANGQSLQQYLLSQLDTIARQSHNVRLLADHWARMVENGWGVDLTEEQHEDLLNYMKPGRNDDDASAAS